MEQSQRTPETVTDLSNQFLMAMPGMVSGDLAGTVIYLCEHNSKGALGLVINRPTDLSVAGLLEKIDLKLEIAPGQSAEQQIAHSPAVFLAVQYRLIVGLSCIFPRVITVQVSSWGA